MCYSYPLFSFQGSNPLSLAVEDYFIRSSFCCQALFSFFSNFFLCFVALHNFYILSDIFHLVKYFFKYFLFVCRCCFSNEEYFITSDPACQCFSSKTFAVDFRDIHFSVLLSAATVTYYTRFPTNVNTFFSTFFIFLHPPLFFLYIHKKTG